jgi:hypothetical protein
MNEPARSPADIAAILAQLEPGELDVLAGMDRAEIAALIEEARIRHATAARLGRVRKSLTVRHTETIMYEAGAERPGRPGRILVRGAGPTVEVQQDGNWLTVPVTLPEGFRGKGEGTWQNFALQPTSSAYAPINWVRRNYLLEQHGAVHGPMPTPEEFARLPGTGLRSPGRRPIVLAYLLGSDNPAVT